MENTEDIRLRILCAVAQEEEEMAKMFEILRDKMRKTRDWLPGDLKALPPNKAIELAVCMEKTIGEEIRALAEKERAIAEKVEAVNKHCPTDCCSDHEPHNPCHRPDCHMFYNCQQIGRRKCPLLTFCS